MKLFLSIFFKLIITQEVSLQSIYEKKLIKALVGFLEPLCDLLDDGIQEVFSEFMAKDLDRKIRVQFIKYLFLDLSFVFKTPLNFQRFSSKLVLSMYSRRELKMEQYISLDWTIKYLTIYSILDTTDDLRESVPGGISSFRNSSTPGMDDLNSAERAEKGNIAFNYAIGNLA